ncbi:MAG: chemotaxis protein CheD [Bacteroidales bacterium]|nr:chemotaxis protein CheD [Bacteroidales bacterium]
MTTNSYSTTAKFSNQQEHPGSLPVHYLYPAALFANRQPHLVNTILGSCVAVCLFDKALKIGGINHYMLPFWNGIGLASPKYGNIAIEKLYGQMLSFGSKHYNIEAKVFGGGEVIETKSANFNIGTRNVQFALETLEEMKIHVVGKSVGGKQGRKIQFISNTGEVRQKFVGTNNY